MSPEPSAEQHAFHASRNGKPDWAKTPRELLRETGAARPQRRIWPWGIVAVLALALTGVVFAPVSAPPAATIAGAPDTRILLHPLDVTTVEPQADRKSVV